MTTSQLDVQLGQQYPRIEHTPPLFHSSAGKDAVDLAAVAGLFLDEWQEYVLERSLRERADGKWTCFEVGLVVPRQNGKNALLEARELAGLYLFKEELIIHSAHEFKTAQEAFLKIWTRIKSTPYLLEKVQGYRGDPEALISGVKTAHGQEGITLKNGNRLKFAARTGGSGRGFTGDLIIFDEAFALVQRAMAAMLPTMAAKSMSGNPQLWYTSSTGMPESDVLYSLRERAEAGDPRLGYYEWSIPHWDDLTPEEKMAWVDAAGVPDIKEYRLDPENHRIANPGLNIRISPEFVLGEYKAMETEPEHFDRERLGIWEKLGGESAIPEWPSMADSASLPGELKIFALDVPPSRDSCTISVASFREDGRTHLEVIKQEAGLDWVANDLKDLKEKFAPLGIYVVAGSAAATLKEDCRRKGVKLDEVSFKEYVDGCGILLDDIKANQIRHRNQKIFNDAVKGARKKFTGDTLFYWNRKITTANISPLVSATVANLGLRSKGFKRLKGQKRGKVTVL